MKGIEFSIPWVIWQHYAASDCWKSAFMLDWPKLTWVLSYSWSFDTMMTLTPIASKFFIVQNAFPFLLVFSPLFRSRVTFGAFKSFSFNSIYLHCPWWLATLGMFSPRPERILAAAVAAAFEISFQRMVMIADKNAFLALIERKHSVRNVDFGRKTAWQQVLPVSRYPTLRSRKTDLAILILGHQMRKRERESVLLWLTCVHMQHVGI